MTADAMTGFAERRLRLGLTQKQIAQRVGCDQPTVSRAEMGRAQSDVIARLHEVLSALEHERYQAARPRADQFWAKAAKAPHAGRIAEDIAAVAEILLSGPLSLVGLGERLIDCLPEASRQAVEAAHEPDGGG